MEQIIFFHNVHVIANVSDALFKNLKLTKSSYIIVIPCMSTAVRLEENDCLPQQNIPCKL